MQAEFLSDVLRDWRQAKKAGVPDTALRSALAERAFRVADQARGRERYEALRFIAGLDGARPSIELLVARDRALARVIELYADDGDVMGEFVLRVLRDDEHDRGLREAILRSTQSAAVRAACEFRPLEPLLDRALDGEMITAVERDQLLALFTRIVERYGGAKHPLSAKTWGEFAAGRASEVRDLVLLGEPAPGIVDSAGSNALAQLRGRIVLLCFWGEWCEASRPQFARWRALSKLRSQGTLEILAVNSDAERAVFEAALAREGLDWPNVWDGKDGTSGVNAVRWRVRGWPAWYLIDAQGVLRNRWQGLPEPAEFERALQRLR